MNDQEITELTRERDNLRKQRDDYEQQRYQLSARLNEVQDERDALRDQLDEATTKIAALRDDVANLAYSEEKLEDERDAALARETHLRCYIDRIDCTYREGGDTRHCRIENKCLRCQLDEARAETKAAEDVAERQRQRAKDAERDRDTALAQVVVLREAIQTHSECFTACHRCGEETPNDTDDVCLVLSRTESAARDYTARVRREALEEATAMLDLHRAHGKPSPPGLTFAANLVRDLVRDMERES